MGKTFWHAKFSPPPLSQFLVKFLFEQNPDPTPPFWQMSQILVFFFCTRPLTIQPFKLWISFSISLCRVCKTRISNLFLLRYSVNHSTDPNLSVENETIKQHLFVLGNIMYTGRYLHFWKCSGKIVNVIY